MTKKYFIEIARDIRTAIEHGVDPGAAKVIASNLCVTFKRNNPNFNRDKFMTACGF